MRESKPLGLVLGLLLLAFCNGCREQDNAKQEQRLSELERRVGTLEKGFSEKAPEPSLPILPPTPSPTLAPIAEPQYELIGPPNFVGETRRIYPSQQRCENAKDALLSPIRKERESELETAGNSSATYYLPRLTCVPA